MLPGLEKALGREPEQEDSPPTVESLSAEIERLRASLADTQRQLEFWRGKFQTADAEVSRYQTENAVLTGRLAALSEG